MIARVIAGRWQRDAIGEERRMAPGDVCLVTQPDRPHLSRWDTGVQLQIITLDPSVLLELAAAPGDLVPRFTALSPIPAGDRLLWAAMDHAVATGIGQPTTVPSPVVRRSIACTLASTLLEALPNTSACDPAVRDRVDATRSRVLRTAVAYVHDHAHEDITIGHLAAAAGVSRQAVHLSFRQHLGSTPRGYLERVRLDRAHRDLTDLSPQSTTVDQVARLWGFTRLERFRRDYGHSYGTTPEQTLHS